MPQPYPGQQWKHGWVPLTGGAARSKNHGRKPGAGSALSRMVAEAAETHKRMQERDRASQKTAPKSAAPTAKPALSPAQKPAGKTPEAPTSTAPKTGSKPKPGKKVGADLRNAPLREGDEVRIVEGSRRGKTGTVTGKGKFGAIQVEVDGERGDYSPVNLRSAKDAETSRRADDAIRRAAGRGPAQPDTATPPQPAGPEASIEKIQDDIRSAYDQLASEPGRWIGLRRLREKLAKDLPRDRVDEALRRLERDPNVGIVPDANQKILTQADRDAAVHIGGQDKHLIGFFG